MTENLWFWPSSEEDNDFPDPVAFDAEWQEWRADLSNGPNVYAEIFAREYVQNSWDTIQAELSKLPKGPGRKNGSLKFTFVELNGEDAQNLVANFGLNEFNQRYEDMTDRNRKDARLGESEIISSSNPGKVRVLICSESGGGGMWGHWKTGGDASKQGSRLRFALIQTASEKAGDGAGGSWGHGKKAIANASKCRAIGVYTCHEGKNSNDDKKDVTRRFLGVTYWRRHQANGREHVGLGVLGGKVNEGVENWQNFQPLENEDADSFIDSLGIDELAIRNPNNFEERGSTYIILEPSFEPSDLQNAIERNWWPLTVEEKLEVSISDYEGTQLSIEPKLREELKPFVSAFELAVRKDPGSTDVTELKIDGLEVGKLAVVADTSEGGFSYRSDIEGNTSLVALVRNDMVIAYQPFPPKIAGKPPFVRGAFNVDRDDNSAASDLLKMAEPHLHNVWRETSDGSTPKDAADLARQVLRKISERVKEVREKYSRPEESKNLQFDIFAEILGGKDRTQGPRPPVPSKEPRDFSIENVRPELLGADPKDPTKVKIQASVRISLSKQALKRIKSARVQVCLTWKVLEDGLSGTVDPELFGSLVGSWPKGFVEIRPGVAEGELTHEKLDFKWNSTFFPDDWQILAHPQVETVGSPNQKGTVEE